MPLTKRHRFYFAVSFLLLSGWAWLIFNVSYTGPAFTICLFKNLTGWPCPSCGSTRAVAALFQQGLLQSLYINPVGIVLMTASILTSVWLVSDLLKNRSALYRFYHRCENYLQTHPETLFLLFGVISTNWLWSIYKGL